MKINFKNLIIIMFILLIIRTIYVIYLYNFKYDIWENKVISVDIIGVEKVSDNGISYNVRHNGDKFLLYIKDKKIYNYGDRIKILCSNYENKVYNNPYEFNYSKYLNSNGFISRIYCIKVLDKESSSKKCVDVIYNLREKISLKIEDKIKGRYANILKSLIYGDDTYLDEDIKEKFTNSGLGHILCVSGSHIVYLLFSFENITGSKKNSIISCILLIYFYVISLFNISLLRAIFMYFLKLVYKNSSFIKRWIITAIFILIINPYYIFNVGVIFSFLSVLSMYFFQSQVESKIYIALKAKKRKLYRVIIENISMTISSQILIIPFQIYYFNKLPLISIISNIFIYFTLSILMIFGFYLFILIFIPLISDILIIVCKYLLYVFIFQIEILDKFSFFNIAFPKLSLPIFIIYFTLILIYLYGKKVILISWKNRHVLKKGIRYIKFFCIIYIVIWYIVITYFQRYIIFFNVGQGNMALIHSGTKNVIVDIGSTNKNTAGYIMYNFLKAKNITKIDLILLTHMHDDHINGIEYLTKNNINIQRIGFSKTPTKTTEFNNLSYLIKKDNIAKLDLNYLDKIEVGDIKIEVLNSYSDFKIEDNDIENANSTIYLIYFKNKKILFMGDSTKKTEQSVLKNVNSNKLQNIDILQVSHHGSKTSSYESFLSKISNNTSAIISADKSVYGHPNDIVVELLKKYKFNIYLTEKNGAIVF